MDELTPIYATGALILGYFAVAVARRRFDPFDPVWLFLVGYTQLYVIQPISYHDWAVGVRGPEVVWTANLRVLWALVWFFLVYHWGPGRAVARVLPSPPAGWSRGLAAAIAPPLVLWGLVCAGLVLRSGEDETVSAEGTLFRSFPFVMLVAAILLVVTGRSSTTKSLFLPAGLFTAAAYVFIWMFNGKRSHSLICVLATMCAWYTSRGKRPSWPVLFGTGLAGVMVVGIAIGWRGDRDHERSVAGFLAFIGDFNFKHVVASLNLAKDDDDGRPISYESEEYGGYLLMVDTVPGKSPYDGGASYLRVFSTFIPRIIWPSKPLFGRAQWVSAWIAGSEFERDETFAGPAIGLLGATQLNGGAIGTLIVLACMATVFRAAFAYFKTHAHLAWAQFWWSITYYNAWFTTTNDDPLVWFYYNWGFTALPVVVLMWWGSKGSAAPAAEAARTARGAALAP